MAHAHRYVTSLRWTGNTGRGTSGYRSYSRQHVVTGEGKAQLQLSSEPRFQGDSDRYNPEELLLASLSSCHMLWYLHLCSDAGVIVTDYEDSAEGTLILDNLGDGEFKEVTLYPIVTITAESGVSQAQRLHDEAHRRCFIARSVRFAVAHQPVIRVLQG